MNEDLHDRLATEAVLKVGNVVEVSGRRVFVSVDRNKNLSDLFLNGKILSNVGVNGYVEIRKGFNRLVGRVEGERIVDQFRRTPPKSYDESDKNNRVLEISLIGYLDKTGIFTGGAKELPLIGNEAFLVTRDVIESVHQFSKPGDYTVAIARLFGDELEIRLPVNGLFNSHIAIFGNTGSGKSNTLARIYQELFKLLEREEFAGIYGKSRYLVVDFNGEYTADGCLTQRKNVLSLSTRNADGGKIKLPAADLLDIEVLSVLSDATEKTQKPFLQRTIRRYSEFLSEGLDVEDLRQLLSGRARSLLQMADKEKSHLLLDYFEQILNYAAPAGERPNIREDLEWHSVNSYWITQKGGVVRYLQTQPEWIPETNLMVAIQGFELPEGFLDRLILFLYVQLIDDIIANRAQNEHVAPMIFRFIRRRSDIEKVVEVGNVDLFDENAVAVLDLSNVNLDMKKVLPLLVSKILYAKQKLRTDNSALTLIIDEAHNILSSSSYREAEAWKDYRLETFEEIVKEGRKFGVFLTISSQRPNDISPTISSQAHNYFLHRLINQKDLQTVANTVSYIDRISEESIPMLPVGTCIFSGITTQMPLKIEVYPLSDAEVPKSKTRDIIPPVADLL